MQNSKIYPTIINNSKLDPKF